MTEGEIKTSPAGPLREIPGATGKITRLPGELASTVTADHCNRKVCLMREVYGLGKIARSEFYLVAQADKLFKQRSKEWDVGGIREVDPDAHHCVLRTLYLVLCSSLYG